MLGRLLADAWCEDALADVLGVILMTNDAVEVEGASLRDTLGIAFRVVSYFGFLTVVRWLEIIDHILERPEAPHRVRVSSLAVTGIDHVISLLLEVVSEIVLAAIIPLLDTNHLPDELLWRSVERPTKFDVRISTGASSCSSSSILEVISYPIFLLYALFHPL